MTDEQIHRNTIGRRSSRSEFEYSGSGCRARFFTANRKLATNGLIGNADRSLRGMVGKAKVGGRTGAVDAALVGPADFRTCPSRQKIDNLFSEILKNNGKGIAPTN